MKKIYEEIDIKPIAGFMLILILMFGVVKEHDKALHISYKPGYFMDKYKREQVDFLRDSTLETRLITYDLLRKDFQKAYETYRQGRYKYNTPEYDHRYIRSTIQTPFDSTKNVHPVFAKQYGIKNIADYDKFLTQYERDSIDSRYKELYLQQIDPKAVFRNQKTR